MSKTRTSARARLPRPGSMEDLVLELLARNGELTRHQLAGFSGRSRSALTPAIAALREHGLIIERESVSTAGRGRNPRRLALTSAYGLTIAVTLGHAEMRSAAAEVTGHLIEEDRTAVPVDDSPAASLDRAAEAIIRYTEVHGGADRKINVAVGLPCPIDSASGRIMANNILPGWGKTSPAQELFARTGLPVLLENDANLAALGEAAHGAGHGWLDFLYLRASAGIGIGVILDGRLYRGRHGTAGEIGHTSVGESQELCRCGNRGCLETVAGTGAITRAMREIHGRRLAWSDVVQLMADNEPGTRRLVNDSARAAARILATLCHVLDLDGVVAGGDIPDASPPYLNALRHAISDYHEPLFSAEPIPVRAARLGTRADLVGAVCLPRERQRQAVRRP